MNERILTRADLRASGLTPRAITEAVRSGRLVRLRRDRYADPAASAHLARAVATGGRIGCVTALAAAGVWTGKDARTHVSLDPGASRIRRPDPRGAVLHWRAPIERVDRSSASSIVDALIDAAHCLPFPFAVASIDSALNLGILQPSRLADIRAALPRRLRRVVDRADGRCMSGLETLLRLALEDAGIPFEVQVGIRGVGTVDFVIAGRLIVETDGHQWHSDEKQTRRDYDRDLAAARAGYVVLRLDYHQVVFEREACIEAIRALVRAVSVRNS